MRKACLQVQEDESLWPYQTVVFHDKRFSLTRLGFGLNIAALVLKRVLATVLSWVQDVNRATSAYIDDFLSMRVLCLQSVLRHTSGSMA